MPAGRRRLPSRIWRRRWAAAAGVIALLLQFWAGLLPAAAMSPAGGLPTELWGSNLCSASPTNGSWPAKQKHEHRHDRCQICQTLQSLGWASPPRQIGTILPPPASAPSWEGQGVRAAGGLTVAGFSSRAPPHQA